MTLGSRLGGSNNEGYLVWTRIDAIPHTGTPNSSPTIYGNSQVCTIMELGPVEKARANLESREHLATWWPWMPNLRAWIS